MKATPSSSVSARPFGLSPSPSTAGYVSDGQVARGGATEGLEKTKGARESDRKAEREEGRRNGERWREGKDGRYYLPPDAERFYLFGLTSASFEFRVEEKGIEASIRQLGGRCRSI